MQSKYKHIYSVIVKKYLKDIMANKKHKILYCVKCKEKSIYSVK